MQAHALLYLHQAVHPRTYLPWTGSQLSNLQARDQGKSNQNDSHNPVPSECRCVVCADWLSEPHALACGHYFCYACIKGAIIGHIDLGESANCPRCRVPIRMRPIRLVQVGSILWSCVITTERELPGLFDDREHSNHYR